MELCPQTSGPMPSLKNEGRTTILTDSQLPTHPPAFHTPRKLHMLKDAYSLHFSNLHKASKWLRLSGHVLGRLYSPSPGTERGPMRRHTCCGMHASFHALSSLFSEDEQAEATRLSAGGGCHVHLAGRGIHKDIIYSRAHPPCTLWHWNFLCQVSRTSISQAAGGEQGVEREPFWEAV